MQDMLHLANLFYIARLHEAYLEDKNSVDAAWQAFFTGLDFGKKVSEGKDQKSDSDDTSRIKRLLLRYRFYGHLKAKVNPVKLYAEEETHWCDLEEVGFLPREMESIFPTCGFMKEEKATLRDIVRALESTYCGSIGYEYMQIENEEEIAWFEDKVEPLHHQDITIDEKKQILEQVNRSEVLEAFIQVKYPGKKRFSIEGGESLIPLCHMLLKQSASLGVKEVVFGMAHRGRLNVLANIFGKSYRSIFYEFGPGYTPLEGEGSGDVKYHKGHKAGYVVSEENKLDLELLPNPSHLESVDPVLLGRVKARQEISSAGEVLPVLIHGDASIAGQGVVYETLQLSSLNGYSTGGTIHIVINNQVGFTAHPEESRSTLYATDIARTFRFPVFHVNAEDPEACVYVAKLAAEYRSTFGKGVFIEILCYRKYGHNEGDEPTFSHPMLYDEIKGKMNIRDLYSAKLLSEQVITKQENEAVIQSFKEMLEQEKAEAQNGIKGGIKREVPPPAQIKDNLDKIVTTLSIGEVQELAKNVTSVPDSFAIHSKLKRLLKQRLDMVESMDSAVDWGMAETLAYAHLLKKGVHIRLSGQDSMRGTFSHRHAVLTDQKNGEKFVPLNHVAENQARFDVYNSPLSEYAVLGFEFGYNLGYKDSLVIWEAQFGDFANGAEIIIDQYIAASEQKWSVFSSLTLFLPHGYEGEGPEHSSARIERFLQLASENNMRIVYPSSSAQFFHIICRQGMRKERKPLIVFTPKGLLRFAPALSPLSEMTEKGFQTCIDDTCDAKGIDKVIFCSGKVYYDLLSARNERSITNVAIVRIEQLFPLDGEKICALLDKYKDVQEKLWVQEEPKNMGAWSFMALHFPVPLKFVGRKPSASTASGSPHLHKKELDLFIKEALES